LAAGPAGKLAAAVDSRAAVAAAVLPVGSMAVGMQVAAGVDSIRLVGVRGGRRVIGRSTVEPTYCAVCSLCWPCETVCAREAASSTLVMTKAVVGRLSISTPAAREQRCDRLRAEMCG